MTEQLTALRTMAEKLGADLRPRYSDFRDAFSSPCQDMEYAERADNARRACGMGSLDSAMSLFNSLFPGWTCCIVQNMFHKYWVSTVTHILEDGAAVDWSAKHDDNPSHALLLAIIRAKIAELEEVADDAN